MTLIIFFLAASFRITNLDLIEFKADEAINLLLSSRPLFDHPFSPGGTVSSLGILNPPLFNFLLFPVVAINSDPKFVVFFIGLINSIAVAVFYLIVKRYYGLTIALISGTLLALSPWAIIFSRKIWMQDLLIPFFLPVFYSIHKLVVEKKSVYWLPYTIFSLFLIQLHQASLIFIGILTFFILFQKVKLSLKYIALGLLIGLFPLIPYVIYELRNGCPDCQALIAARGRLNIYSFEIFLRPLQILSQGNFRFLLGDDTLTFAQKFPFIDLGRKIFYFEYILVPLGLLIFFKKYKNLKFLSLAVILLPFVYFALKFEPFMHYFIIAIPLLFLFLAIAFNFLIFNKNLLLKIGSRFLLISLIMISIIFNGAFFELLRSKGSLKGDYGTAYYIIEAESKKKLNRFEKLPDYDEIYLSSFIPLSYVYGYQPLGKVLYPNITYEQVLNLESELQQESGDPRIKQKIVTFYTKSKPTLETLDILREKTSKIPQYEPLYKEVLGDYLSKNFKKEYLWQEGGFRFFYPEHWKVEKETKRVIISGDGYSIYIDDNGHVASSQKTSAIDDIARSVRPL